MNKKVLLVLVITTILTTITAYQASAQAATCYDNQTIIFLSGATNAHGAIGANSGYTSRICYDKIFGTPYTGTNPTSCTTTNKIVRLSGNTNAHAEQVGQTTQGYSDVCYGNLACVSRTLQNCQEGEKEVLRLSSQKNSHLAVNGSAGPIAVCCRILGNLSGARWENLIGQEIIITSTGSTVAMVVPGTDLDKTTINYTIEKQTTNWFFFKTWNVASSSSTKGIKTEQLNDEGIYRFRAKIPGQTEKVSAELQVITSTSTSNSPPRVAIKAPIDTGIYFLNQTLNFTAEVTDTDDPLLTYSWSFGDGQISTLANVYKIYSSPGQKTIILRVTDSRGAYGEAKAEILLVNSSYMLAYISSPTYNQIIQGLTTTFNASGKSYVVNVTYSPFSIRCVAGNCPNQTADGQISIQGTPAAIDNINFSWALSDGYTRSGQGSSTATVTYKFTTPGQKSARMNISISPQFSSMTWTNFTVYQESGVPYCKVVGSSSTWITSEGSASSINDCYNPNAQAGQQMCCPLGYTCTQQGSTSVYKCLPGGSSGGVASCADYTTQTACNAFNPTVAQETVKAASQGAVTCGGIIKHYEENGKFYREIADNCRCVWDASASAGTQCKSSYDTIKECVDGLCGQQQIGSCETSVALSQDLCSQPQKVKVYNINSVWTGSVDQTPESCKSGSIQKGCVDFAQIRLPFFNYLQLIITIAIITGFYYYKKRRN
ncbi:MAG: PKD domain-containing protein [Nanoarchaeota archaeon]